MGVYEVTQAQWQTVMGSNPSTFNDNPNKPVETISWYDAQEFIRKLNTLEQGTFRLPTEAEWELACRAGTRTRFFWGEDSDYSESGKYGWSSANNSPYGTKIVGQLLPNPYGLYDICGMYSNGVRLVQPLLSRRPELTRQTGIGNLQD